MALLSFSFPQNSVCCCVWSLRWSMGSVALNKLKRKSTCLLRWLRNPWQPFITLASLNDVGGKREPMKPFLAWWYQLALPKRDPDITPEDRECTRYARLTSTFSLLILCITLPTAVNTIINDVKQTGPIVA